MKRRTFLQSLLALPTIPLIRQKARAAQPAQPTIEVEYTDSNNNTPATLAALSDGDRQTGGVTYQP